MQWLHMTNDTELNVVYGERLTETEILEQLDEHGGYNAAQEHGELSGSRWERRTVRQLFRDGYLTRANKFARYALTEKGRRRIQ